MSDLSLQIIPSEVKPKDTKAEKLNPKLQKPPFVFCIVGAAGTGKSSLIWTICESWYKSYFDYILIYNGVLDANDTFSLLEDTKTSVQVVNEWDPKKFEKWLTTLDIEQQKLHKEKIKKRNVLVIFDDFITKDISKKTTVGILDRAVQNRRHYNLSIIYSSQSYKQINRSMRSLNCSAVLITGVNDSDLKIIAEEHTTPYYDEKDVVNLYKESMKEGGYKVFVIDYKDTPKNRFKINFDKVLEQ